LFKNKVTEAAPRAEQYVEPVPQQFGNRYLGPRGRAQAEKEIADAKARAISATEKPAIQHKEPKGEGKIGPGMQQLGMRTYLVKDDDMHAVFAAGDKMVNHLPGQSPKEQQYMEWQKEASRWAYAFDGHGHPSPGAPPKIDDHVGKNKEAKAVMRKQWTSAAAWQTGAGLAVDFDTPTSVFGSRKDKGTPGCLSASPTNLTGKKKEILTRDKITDGLEGLPRKWKGTLELGARGDGQCTTTRPETAMEETGRQGARRGGSDFMRCAAPDHLQKKFGKTGPGSSMVFGGGKRKIDEERVVEAMHPVDAMRSGARMGENRINFKPSSRVATRRGVGACR